MKYYKVFIDSTAWMCEGNIVETSRIYRYLLANGHAVTRTPSEADFFIINSCGFVQERENLSLDLYNNFVSQKKDSAKIILFGCLVRINKEKVHSLDAVAIDFHEGHKFDELFFTKVKFDDVLPYCDNKTTEELQVANKTLQESKIISFFISRIMMHFSKKVRGNYDAIMNRVRFKDKNLVEICSGCIFQCRYCAIRIAKNEVHSNSITSILSYIEKIYDPSQNLFLVADDCGCYGLDINEDLFHLLYEINRKFPGATIELDAINPYWLMKYPDEYTKLFRDLNIDYVAIPVQSGSNRVLRDMNRKYDIKKIQEIVQNIKKMSPPTWIYTHFIVGYPGENFMDFLQSLRCSMYFDLPIVLEYSEHSGESADAPRGWSKFAASYRFAFFMIFLNVVIFYKLLTFNNQK